MPFVKHEFMKLDAMEIREILPHRYPLLLVDRVEEVIRGSQSPMGDRIIAYKGVTQNELFFQGHFPNQPLMPGVLVLEALAQALALLTFRYISGTKEDYHVYLTGIENAKFRKPVVPGDLLRLEGEVKKVSMKKFWVTHGEAYVISPGSAKELACEAQFSSMLIRKGKK